MRAGGLALGGGGLSLVAVVLTLLLGGNPFSGGGGSDYSEPGMGGSGRVASPEEEELAQFISVVLADTEETWPALLREQGATYQEPKLVLFTDAVDSACGFAQSAVGPFYCPADARVYIDLGFFEDLNRLGAPGDFAQAYVLAHEVGHHVQNLLGISEQTQRAMQRMGERERNQLSVAVELQADCFAGVWAHHAARERALLEEGDVEEGLRAAAAIGDDRLQRRAQGHVVPESFTHGSSEQRASSLRRGLKEGSVAACDPFRSR